MAPSPHALIRPERSGFTARGRARLIILTVAALIPLAGTAAPASATDPGPATATDAATLMAARAHDLEKVTEAFDAARVTLGTQQAAAQAAKERVQRSTATLTAARNQVRGFARSAYTGDSSMSSVGALLSAGSAAEFTDKVGTLQQLADRQQQTIAAAVAANTAAEQARVAAQAALATAQTTLAKVTAQRAALQGQEAAYSADFARLSAPQQNAALAAAESAAPGTESPVGQPAATGPVPAPSGTAQIAVDTAMAQRGKPYVWAATGPGSFDCSGLTLYAYAAAGISLPHSSAIQATMGTPVSAGQLQPGDLVFYYSPVGHVGMYIGNGMIVHAPTPGDVVKVAGMYAVGTPTAMRRMT